MEHTPEIRQYCVVDTVSGDEWYTYAETPAKAAEHIWAGNEAGTVVDVYDADGAVDMYLGSFVYGEGYEDEQPEQPEQKPIFRAVFDNAVIMEWYAPQTWRNVFSNFKLAGTCEGHGVLYCGDTIIRETGARKQPEPTIEEYIDIDQTIDAMEYAGYHYDEIDSYDGWLVFHGVRFGGTMTFEDWSSVRGWLDGVVFDDPDTSDAVEHCLHPERFEQPKQPHRYLATIACPYSSDPLLKEPTYTIMTAPQIFDRLDMRDCYDEYEELDLMLLTGEGPQPCTWHGTWHDPSDPLHMSITLDATGEVLDDGYGTDH